MSKGLNIDDICYYAPGDVSRMGNQNKNKLG